MLGYTLALHKSSRDLAKISKHLGLLVSSVHMGFGLADEKKKAFADLRELLITSECIDVRSLQRFAGKAVSFSLAVPGAKLFCREVNRAVSDASRLGSFIIVPSEALLEEFRHWRFLDGWDGFLKWRSEAHIVRLASDASQFAYGIKVLSGLDVGVEFRDYCDEGDLRPVHLKEAEAVI